MALITLGLAEIRAGVASTSGTMPGSMTKIGKTYKDTCKLSQAESDVTEHYEEGRSAPEVRNKQKKMPILKFSLMDPDVTQLIDLVGGALTETTKWGFDGSENVVNKAIRVIPEQGLQFDIPNADIEAVINADMSSKGIFMIDVTVTPMAVSAGKAMTAYPLSSLVVTPTSLSFTAAADTTGKTITATSTGNLTYAAADSSAEWLTVTRSAKVATVKVSANTNSEARTAYVTVVADGISAVIPVTQAGV